MKRWLNSVLFLLFGLVLVWGAASWMISSSSEQYFDMALEKMATGQMKNIAEIEVLSDEKTLMGASAMLRFIPATTMLDAGLEARTFILERSNGPVFVSREGFQLGMARWELTETNIVTNASSVSENESFFAADPIASLIVGFFETASLRLEVPSISLAHIKFKRIVLEGDIDIKSYQHELVAHVSELIYSSPYFAVRFPNASLVSTSLDRLDAIPLSAEGLTALNIEAKEGELTLLGKSKKIPFNLQSHGSIWLNNDTLSSDWQLSVASGQLFKMSGEEGGGKSGSFQADVTLQLRELSSSGLGQYLQDQSAIFSLLQQAEWAMEDIETPEQQDFLRALLLEADRIKQTQSDSPLGPLLIAERSQLAVNVKLTTNDSNTPSQLSLVGQATSKAKEPTLPLAGQLKITQGTLNSRGLALLDKWSRRRWFRRYESEFEADIALRNERFLLNDFIVSVDGLSSELTQVLTDQ